MAHFRPFPHSSLVESGKPTGISSMERIRPISGRRRTAVVLLMFAVSFGLLTGCTKPPGAEKSGPAPFSSSTSKEPRQSTASPPDFPPRDLSKDEAAGGHTLSKHVGRTDDQLRERLDHERNISAASTWNDRASAEAAVGAAIGEQNEKILRWLGRDRHPNLVLDYDGDPAHPFGRTLRRGSDRVVPCAHAVIVLKWDPPESYYVLTAYPECRS
jgi:hypothetical protein